MDTNERKSAVAKKKGNLLLINNSHVGKIQNVREIIVRRMKAKRMTAYALAAISGITQQAIRKYMLGKGDMRGEYLARVLAVLELEIRPKE